MRLIIIQFAGVNKADLQQNTISPGKISNLLEDLQEMDSPHDELKTMDGTNSA